MSLPTDSLTLYIRNAEETLYEGEASAVSCINEKGPFDVLPEHESFISIVKEKVTVHKKDRQKHEIQIDSGIIKVYKNAVYILLGIGAMGMETAANASVQPSKPQK